MTKIFEIRGAGFLNQGAAMMLLAATREIRHAFPSALITVAPNGALPFHSRTELGLWHRAELEILGADLGKLVNVVPERLRRLYGFVTEAEVDIIIDAAGFAYSDQWGVKPTQELARRAYRWSRQGKKLILLPQAFGPFTSLQLRQAICKVADYATLMFARDSVSYRHLIEVVGQRDNIRIAPDFTNLLESYVPNSFNLAGRLVAMVPNCRMLDKTRVGEKKRYVPLFVTCAKKLQQSGMTPFFLIHAGLEDYRLAERINTNLSKPLPIFQYDNPLKIKGVLGACDGVIASRFHAVVSALSQGVACLGTGWSHKYQALFNDYDCPHALLSTLINDDDLDVKLALLSDKKQQVALAQSICLHGDDIRKQVRSMWKEIFSLV